MLSSELFFLFPKPKNWLWPRKTGLRIAPLLSRHKSQLHQRLRMGKDYRDQRGTAGEIAMEISTFWRNCALKIRTAVFCLEREFCQVLLQCHGRDKGNTGSKNTFCAFIATHLEKDGEAKAVHCWTPYVRCCSKHVATEKGDKIVSSKNNINQIFDRSDFRVTSSVMI